MRVWTLCLLLAAGLSAPMGAQPRALQPQAPVTTLPAKNLRWAVLIGVDDYQDGQISRLQGAANDARALKKTLVTHAGFPADQVIVLASGEPGGEPTRANILTRLSNTLRQVPKDGLLMLAFSGHGIERDGKAFLLASDSILNSDAKLLEETSVSVDRLRAWVRDAGVQQVVVALDACRNEPGGRADLVNPLTKAYTDGFRFDVRNREVRAFATLYATAVGSRAWENTAKRRGYFMWALEQAISGQAANAEGQVTLGAAIRYVQEQVPRQVKIDLGPDRDQRPFFQMEGYRADDLVLSIVIRQSGSRSDAESGEVEAEIEFWRSVERGGGKEFYQEYLKRYPNGRFASLARLKVGGNAAVPPPTPAPVVTGLRKTGIAEIDALVAKAQTGDISALTDLGYRYAQGQGVTKDAVEGVRLYRIAAEAGNRTAMFNLANAYDNGAGVAANEAEAVRWYRKAAELGQAGAINNLGRMHENGRGGLKQDYAEALRLFRKSDEAGNAFGAYNIGRFYENGLGVAKNPAEALRWYEKAAAGGHQAAKDRVAELSKLTAAPGLRFTRTGNATVDGYMDRAEKGDINAVVDLGYAYDTGAGVAKNAAEAFRLYKLAADRGNKWGQANLGVMYRDGTGTAKNEAEAARMFRLAMDQGHAGGMNNLGRLYEDGVGVPKNLAEALRLFRLSEAAGNEYAAYNIARFYESGLGGLTRDLNQARGWYQKAADKGHKAAKERLAVLSPGAVPALRFARTGNSKVDGHMAKAESGDTNALVDLGYCYETGDGVIKNGREAFRLYKLAADQGNKWGLYNAAVMYRNGDHVTRNDAEAVRLYRAAIAQGHDGAMNNLARLYEEGLGGLPKDYAEAVRLFRQSAAAGNQYGAYNLGRFYENGWGVPKDVNQAKQWYQTAAAKGHQASKDRLAVLR